MQQNRHLLFEAELIFQRHFLGLVHLQQSNKTLVEVCIVHGDTKIIRFIPAQLTPFTGSKLRHDIITTCVLVCYSLKKRCSRSMQLWVKIWRVCAMIMMRIVIFKIKILLQ